MSTSKPFAGWAIVSAYMPNRKAISRRSGVRVRLFVALLGLMLGVAGAIGIYFESLLRNFLGERVEAGLLGHARTIAEILRLRDEDSQELVRRLSKAHGYRITLIDPSGKVVADSALSRDALATVDNHADRPEVLQARLTGHAVARRTSATIDEPLLYVAVDAGDTLVRVATSLVALDGVMRQLQFALLGAAVVGLAVAAIMSLLSAHLLTRELRKLVGHAKALARGERSTLPWYSTEELGRLAGSFTKLAGQLEHTMDALANERYRFSIVLESMSEAVLTVDKSLKIALVNPACVSILGLKGEPVGEPLDEAVSIPDLVSLAQEGRLGSASGEFQVDRRIVLARAMPLATSGGSVVVMHDVTDMRRLEIIRKDFVANVSHELRTPVSIVRANAETLLEGALDDPERARYFIEALYRNADRLSRIIADLLDLSQIEAGQFHLSVRGISVKEAFERTIESLLARADSRRISLEVLLEEDIDVLADRKALDQVLSNLVENGIKYTPEGGRIRLHAKQVDDKIRIEVEDDGQGIPEEHWGRIFERFYRVDTGRSRDMGGTGLGLAIVRHLVESMGGEVGVEAGQPRGARFWITLPRSRMREVRAA